MACRFVILARTLSRHIVPLCRAFIVKHKKLIISCLQASESEVASRTRLSRSLSVRRAPMFPPCLSPQEEAIATKQGPTAEMFFRSPTSQPELNLGGRTPELAQGRAWGGDSAVNYMAYGRGALSVFDGWADISGDPGLGWSPLSDDFKATTHFKFEPPTHDPLLYSNSSGDKEAMLYAYKELREIMQKR